VSDTDRDGAVDRKNQEGLLALQSGDRARAALLFAEAVALAGAGVEPTAPAALEALYNRATHPPADLTVAERARDLEQVVGATDGGSSPRARALHAAACHNLAVVIEEQGDIDRARDAYARALKARQSELGADHPRLRPTLVRLAQLEHRAGRTLFALDLYERALVLARRELGPDHREVRTLEAWRADLTGEG